MVNRVFRKPWLYLVILAFVAGILLVAPRVVSQDSGTPDDGLETAVFAGVPKPTSRKYSGSKMLFRATRVAR
jgi:hypothetical protein